MRRTIDSAVANFLRLKSSLLSLPIREFKKLRLLLQRKRRFKIELCVRLTVSRLFHVDHVVQNKRGALSFAWFSLKNQRIKDLLLRVGVVVRVSNKQFKIYDATAATTPQILHMQWTKTNLLHVLHVLLLFLSISFPFSANLRRGMTFSQVIKRTWKHRREFEFSFLTLTPHL